MVYSCIKHAIIITLFTGGLAEAQLLKLATKHQGASFFEGMLLRLFGGSLLKNIV
jgi:hypothetical protein